MNVVTFTDRLLAHSTGRIKKQSRPLPDQRSEAETA
jgi:hypothetical protein